MMEPTNRLDRGGLHRIRDSNDSGERTIDRDPERRLAFFRQPSRFCRQSLHRDAVDLHQHGIADHGQISSTRPMTPCPVCDTKLSGCGRFRSRC
jgi:hypothetical protein